MEILLEKQIFFLQREFNVVRDSKIKCLDGFISINQSSTFPSLKFPYGCFLFAYFLEFSPALEYFKYVYINKQAGKVTTFYITLYVWMHYLLL